jgi:anti-sigma B factor antagonist
MAFSAKTEVTSGIAHVVLTGELDASSAPDFKAAIEKVSAEKPRRLVLMMQDLEYMASAGLRVLIFAKQKLGPSSDMFIIGAQPSVVETLQMTGFHHSAVLLNDYDAARIEQ